MKENLKLGVSIIHYYLMNFTASYDAAFNFIFANVKDQINPDKM